MTTEDVPAHSCESQPFATPIQLKAGRIIGKRLQFRNALISDAEFILSLRLDETKNRFLSAVSDDLSAQQRWLECYAADPAQAYFVIETLDRLPVGTVRLYDAKGASFSWGSWILNGDAPKSAAIETTLMVYSYGLKLGFTASHFEVRKGNEKVWRYHERCGATRTHEDELNYYYTIQQPRIEELLARYRDRLPEGISIQP